MARLTQSIRCVLMTAFGAPVEPEVSRYLATVSGSIAAIDRATSSVGSVSAIEANGTASGTRGGERL